MVWSAPASRAAAAFSGEETVVSTVAPAALANWMAYWPTAPAPPATSTVVPLPAPASATAWTAVIAGMPRQAPASKLIVVRQLDRLRGRQRDVFGGGAEGALPLPVPDPHPLAERDLGDAVADLVDDAGAVALRDQRAARRSCGWCPGAI